MVARWIPRGVFAITALLFGTQASAVTAYRLAMKADAVPNSAGWTFSSFNSPFLNSGGVTAFNGAVLKPGSSNPSSNAGIWTTSAGGLTSFALSGGSVVGTADMTYAQLTSPFLDDSGKIAFYATVVQHFSNGTQSNNLNAVYYGTSSGVTLAARDDQTINGYTGIRVSFVQTFNTGNRLSFIDNSQPVAGAPPTLYPEFTTATADLPSGTSWQSTTNVHQNHTDQVAFEATLSGTSGGRSFWYGAPNAPKPLVYTFMTAPGSNGAVFQASSWNAMGSINNAGTFIFSATLKAGTAGISLNNDDGLWAGALNSYSRILKENDSIGGLPGYTYRTFQQSAINDDGTIAFSGTITRPDATIIAALISDTVNPTVIARGDQALPGYLATQTPDFIQNFSLNAHGQIAFKAQMIGVGINTANNEALYRYVPADGVTLIAKEGDLFDTNQGSGVPDLRIISSISLVLNGFTGDGKFQSFNDNGDLSFALTFTDGTSGVFTTVPEPGSLSFICLGAASFLLRRKRTLQRYTPAR